MSHQIDAHIHYQMQKFDESAIRDLVFNANAMI